MKTHKQIVYIARDKMRSRQGKYIVSNMKPKLDKSKFFVWCDNKFIGKIKVQIMDTGTFERLFGKENSLERGGIKKIIIQFHCFWKWLNILASNY